MEEIKEITFEKLYNKAKKICDELDLDLRGVVQIGNSKSVSLYLAEDAVVHYNVLRKLKQYYGAGEITVACDYEGCKVKIEIYCNWE